MILMDEDLPLNTLLVKKCLCEPFSFFFSLHWKSVSFKSDFLELCAHTTVNEKLGPYFLVYVFHVCTA